MRCNSGPPRSRRRRRGRRRAASPPFDGRSPFRRTAPYRTPALRAPSRSSVMSAMLSIEQILCPSGRMSTATAAGVAAKRELQSSGVIAQLVDHPRLFGPPMTQQVGPGCASPPAPEARRAPGQPWRSMSATPVGQQGRIGPRRSVRQDHDIQAMIGKHQHLGGGTDDASAVVDDAKRAAVLAQHEPQGVGAERPVGEWRRLGQGLPGFSRSEPVARSQMRHPPDHVQCRWSRRFRPSPMFSSEGIMPRRHPPPERGT